MVAGHRLTSILRLESRASSWRFSLFSADTQNSAELTRDGSAAVHANNDNAGSQLTASQTFSSLQRHLHIIDKDGMNEFCSVAYSYCDAITVLTTSPKVSKNANDVTRIFDIKSTMT